MRKRTADWSSARQRYVARTCSGQHPQLATHSQPASSSNSRCSGGGSSGNDGSSSSTGSRNRLAVFLQRSMPRSRLAGVVRLGVGAGAPTFERLCISTLQCSSAAFEADGGICRGSACGSVVRVVVLCTEHLSVAGCIALYRGCECVGGALVSVTDSVVWCLKHQLAACHVSVPRQQQLAATSACHVSSSWLPHQRATSAAVGCCISVPHQQQLDAASACHVSIS
jgi:hypothetical protein